MDNYKIETKCVQEGYKPENGAPRIMPIYQSTTYKYDSSEHLGKLFDLEVPGHMYTRISNPSVEFVENKIASLCGGVGAMITSSGQSANLIAILNIAKAGDNFITSASIYGGTTNLFAVTMKKMGIEARFIKPGSTDEEIDAMFDEHTKAFFGESVANPALTVFDFDRYARIAHSHGVPLIVDNTFPTPIMCRPFEWGADIVTHSTTKYMDGHATTVGGVIIDSGRFDWTNGNFPEFTEPDESYHGVIYTKNFGEAAYITKARVQMMRDIGASPTALSAFLINLGLETLHLRMERHCENAQKIAEFLETHPLVEWVSFPGLKSSPDYEMAQKYMKNGTCGVISFGVKGGREAAMKFMDSLKLAAIVVHVADLRTSVLHPASTTHRQLTDAQLVDAGISADLIRMSIGIENFEDIKADIDNALNIAAK